MENFFRAKGVWSVVEIDFSELVEGTVLTEAQNAHLDDIRLKDHQDYLFQAIDRTFFEQILDCRTAKIVLDSMKRKHNSSQKLIVLSLKKSWIMAQPRLFWTQ